jgi:acyl carrier protein
MAPMTRQSEMFAAPATMVEVLPAFRSALESPDLELSLTTSLEDISGWDSMQQVRVMAELECRFGIALESQEMEAVLTVGDCVRLVGAKRALNAA